MNSGTRAWCPACRTEIPQDFLCSPVMGCPRCRHITNWPDFRPPEPEGFARLERAAERAAAQMLREWQQADTKRRSEIEKRVTGLALVLENA